MLHYIWYLPLFYLKSEIMHGLSHKIPCKDEPLLQLTIRQGLGKAQALS